MCRAVHAVLAGAGDRGGRRPAFGVKISPFSDPRALTSLAERITRLSTELDTLRFVVAVNTFPNGYEIGDGRRQVVAVGLAGVSGAALKPIGMGQVRQLREMLPAGIDVVGVGGVMRGRDLDDYLSVGAVAVQAATVYWNAGENPRVFGEILAGFVDHMDPSLAEPIDAT